MSGISFFNQWLIRKNLQETMVFFPANMGFSMVFSKSMVFISISRPIRYWGMLLLRRVRPSESHWRPQLNGTSPQKRTMQGVCVFFWYLYHLYLIGLWMDKDELMMVNDGLMMVNTTLPSIGLLMVINGVYANWWLLTRLYSNWWLLMWVKQYTINQPWLGMVTIPPINMKTNEYNKP